MNILVTGFKPFNKENINPTELILKRIKDEYKNVFTLLLNVEYNLDSCILLDAIKRNIPDVLICLGQAGGRKKVMVENYALNMQSAVIPDNNNILLKHQKINESGNICYETNVDLLKLVHNVNDESFGISYHAGTFICNEIYYRALEFINNNKLNTKCIFVHIPYIKEQVIDKPNMPYLELDKTYEIITKIIKELSNV